MPSVDSRNEGIKTTSSHYRLNQENSKAADVVYYDLRNYILGYMDPPKAHI